MIGNGKEQVHLHICTFPAGLVCIREVGMPATTVTFFPPGEQYFMKSDLLKALSTRFVAERHTLMGFIYTMVRDLAASEDIFQEVWIRLQEAIERGQAIDDPARWCRAVAKNLILHYWREKRVSKIVADTELLHLVEQALNEQPEDWSDQRQALLECIDQLPDRSRQLLRMKYDEGLSFATMAERLGRSVGGLKMALCRVRLALQECVNRKLRSAE
ncbi:ECF RNA polymerase sigma factor SigW [bacterium HR36]|nr:ECF RNA polymerase sigma factor SigW [bacterium HR36]